MKNEKNKENELDVIVLEKKKNEMNKSTGFSFIRNAISYNLLRSEVESRYENENFTVI